MTQDRELRRSEGRERPVSGTAVAAVLFALVGAGVAYRYWPGEERDIRRHLSNLAEALTTPADPENEAVRATRMAAIREYFAPDVRVLPVLAAGPALVPEPLFSREAVLRTIDQTTRLGQISVQLIDASVRLAADGAAADVTVVARVARADHVGGRQDVDLRRLEVTMAKTKGDWVITAVEEHPREEGRMEERERPPRP
jgi:ketosteroid isomerase-like protein